MSERATLPAEVRAQLPEAVQAYIGALEADNAALEARLEALEAYVRQHSQNSSRPPSSDPPDAPPRPQQPKSKRKRGGQKGHRGHHRALLDASEVSQIVEHWPAQCPDCQHPLPPVDVPGSAPQRQQVWELPPVQAVVTEHRYHRVCCPHCHRQVRATRPPDVPPGAFGPHLTSLVGLLNGRYRLSKREVGSLLHDAWGIAISSGSVVRCGEQVSQALAQPVVALQQVVAQSGAVNVDETGWKEAHQRRWLWVAVTPHGTRFHLAASRKGAELDPLLGPSYTGLVTSDRFSAYKRLPVERRQLCWAHLKRDLVAFSEAKGAAGAWGERALQVVAQLFALWHRFRQSELDRAALQQQMVPVRTTFRALLQEGEGILHYRLRGFCGELLKLEAALWTFLGHEGVEPTNNAAERALRPAVLWRKGSFGSDSPAGLRFVERFLSVAATCRQQGRHLLTFLSDALTAFWTGQPAPLLVPTT
jgi:hypothetical protein